MAFFIVDSEQSKECIDFTVLRFLVLVGYFRGSFFDFRGGFRNKCEKQGNNVEKQDIL